MQVKDNSEIASILSLYGKLLELHGENDFKSKIYTNASFAFKKIAYPLSELSTEDIQNNADIPKSYKTKILSILATGTFDELENILQITPIGLLDVLKIRGLGSKKVRELWLGLGIESETELLYACQENRLVELKGFGEKTQSNIIKEIEFRENNKNKFLYAKLEPIALELFKTVSAQNFVSKIEFSGPFRRKCEILDSLDFVISCTNVQSLNSFFIEIGFDPELFSDHILLKLNNNFPIVFWLSGPNEFVTTQFVKSASEGHLSNFKTIPSHVQSELAIYEANSLPFIIPERREGFLEFERPDLQSNAINYTDLKGALHNHSTWSDGKNSIEEMALFCMQQNWDYLAICDHSQTAIYAGGLTVERVIAQHQEIDVLNKKYPNFKILKGIESDILLNGSLDYGNDILQLFDVVVASIHSSLKMEESKATERLIKAIENPYTNILGHPSGRLLLGRNGYSFDVNKILDACAANKVSIELNANPYRLDLDWRYLHLAMDKGVKVAINPDAHSLKGLLDMQYGVYVAQKAALDKRFVLNAMDYHNLILSLQKK
jgi:DNA polymerase (family X)